MECTVRVVMLSFICAHCACTSHMYIARALSQMQSLYSSTNRSLCMSTGNTLGNYSTYSSGTRDYFATLAHLWNTAVRVQLVCTSASTAIAHALVQN
eukprot:240094-Pyramimonas_sp.AAC.1